MKHKFAPIWLYTVYRNSDDKLMALDVTGREAAKVMGIKFSSLYHFMCVRGGRNSTWTVTRKTFDEVEEETNA